MTTLAAVWDKVLELLADNISVIAVRDKEEEFNGKKWFKKQPFGKWEKAQREHATKEELWFMMDKFGTTAIATVCGEISGKMEVIDVDVKWEKGIDVLLFNELKSVVPDLFPKLRIHKTPSGGWHIIYRVADGTIPGNKKLAMRDSTEEELKDDPKSKYKCFLETRGEGGYIVAPPSLEYKVAQAVPIPVITWQERDTLINVCHSFNRVVKAEKVYSTPNADSVYYDVNPFEHFNISNDGEQVLLQHGWTYHSKNDRALYFTRPGSKSGDLHAAFLFEKRLYRFFTTNSEFSVDRSYKPATVLGILSRAGDMKPLYQDLVKRGFGQVKKAVEKSIIKKAVTQGGELPANVSVEAKQDYTRLLEQVTKAHPHGTFWEFGEKGGIEIIRERLYIVADGLGFRQHRGKLYQVEDKFIYERTATYFFNLIKQYIQEEDGDIYIDICSSYEAFVQKSGDFTIGRMREIARDEILYDTATICYKYYQNGFLTITATDTSLQPYAEIKKLIFASRIQPRPYNTGEPGGKYAEFLNLACRYAENTNYINSILGYLSHEYKDSTTAYVVVLTEECPDPKQGGGSGKNVFCMLLGNTTTHCEVSGSQIKFDEKFLQAWDGQRIMVLSDVDKKFNYGFLKNMSSGNGKLKKLYHDEEIVDVADMPKFLIQTNYGVDKVDGGMIRRIRQIEFTQFFTQRTGVDVYFGCMFPQGFSIDDWAGYDNLIARSIQQWIAGGLKIGTVGLTDGGALKQFDQTHGINTREFFTENWDDWSAENFITTEDLRDKYKKFCDVNEVHFRLSNHRINEALADWCKYKGYSFDSEKVKKVNGLSKRGKEFLPPDAPF